MEKTAIIALGGNALSDKSQAGTINDQFSNTRKSLTEIIKFLKEDYNICICLLYTSPSPRDERLSSMPSSA